MVSVKSVLLAGVVTLSLGGQAMAAPVFYNGYKPPKDSLGRPDLNGVWSLHLRRVKTAGRRCASSVFCLQ